MHIREVQQNLDATFDLVDRFQEPRGLTRELGRLLLASAPHKDFRLYGTKDCLALEVIFGGNCSCRVRELVCLSELVLFEECLREHGREARPEEELAECEELL